MVLENCAICMNYWLSRGRYMEGYQHLIHDRHIPEAHQNITPVQPAGPSVSDLQHQLDAANSRNRNLQNQLNIANSQVTSLQTQLGAANSRANDLQKQLDDCKKAKKILEDEVTKLKTDKVNLENVNKTLTDASNKKDKDVKKYYDDKLKAENRIQTVLDPYIKQLQNILANNSLTYPPTPP